MSDYIVNKVAVDWLTLTTWHESAHTRLVDFVKQMGWKPYKDKLWQYKGLSYEEVFLGEAKQAGADNFIVNVYGNKAHWLLLCLLTESYDLKIHSWNVTRLDVQLSLAIPDYRLRAWQWVARGKGRNIIHRSQNGLDTVYIGTRGSDKFLRVYVKDDLYNDDESFAGQIIRWEYELRGQLARGMWEAIRRGDDLTGMWSYMFNVTIKGKQGARPWADVVCPVLAEAFSNIPTTPYTRAERETDTMKWLSTAVTTSISRMLSDHDRRHAMIQLLHQWGREAEDWGLFDQYQI